MCCSLAFPTVQVGLNLSVQMRISVLHHASVMFMNKFVDVYIGQKILLGFLCVSVSSRDPPISASTVLSYRCALLHFLFVFYMDA